METYQDLFDSPWLLSLDQLLEDSDNTNDIDNLPLHERFRDETEDEAYYREAMEMKRRHLR